MGTYRVLELKNFRSYSDYSLELSENVNIVVGPNASGKTNLLEALYVLSRGKSFRASEKDLIQFDKPWLRLDGRWNDSERTFIYKLNEDGTKSKELRVNDKVYRRLSGKQLLPTTLFDPEHMRLISGSPETRRTFMDTLLEQVNEEYASHIRQYKRAIAQRNRLLKSLNPSPDHLFVWDLKLAEHGVRIRDARMKLMDDINQQASEIYTELAGKKSTVALNYLNSLDSEDYQSSLLKALHERHKIDMQRGFTTIGPHREDFEVILNDYEASSSASRGETRTAVLMAKIMELKLLEQHTGTRPLLLLDDVFSELDGTRRRALTEFLKPYQTIITTTDADAIVKRYLKNYTVIPLGGKTT